MPRTTARGARRPWTCAEDRYLLRHRTDGADRLAAALGRTPGAVRYRASRVLGVSLRARPGELCPVCGCYEVRPHTASGRNGMCPVCWEVAKTDAIRERRATQAAERAYDLQKHLK